METLWLITNIFYDMKIDKIEFLYKLYYNETKKIIYNEGMIDILYKDKNIKERRTKDDDTNLKINLWLCFKQIITINC